MSAWEDARRRQELVDAAVAAMVAVLEAGTERSLAATEPEKWDDEYAMHSINDCIDRMCCAPDAGMPKPSPDVVARWHEVMERAAPFLREDVPLPGAVERLAQEIVSWIADPANVIGSPEYAQRVASAPTRERLTLEIAEGVARANELPADKRVQLAVLLGAPDDTRDAEFAVDAQQPGGLPGVRVLARLPVDVSRVKVNFTVEP